MLASCRFLHSCLFGHLNLVTLFVLWQQAYFLCINADRSQALSADSFIQSRGERSYTTHNVIFYGLRAKSDKPSLFSDLYPVLIINQRRMFLMRQQRLEKTELHTSRMTKYIESSVFYFFWGQHFECYLCHDYSVYDDGWLWILLSLSMSVLILK